MLQGFMKTWMFSSKRPMDGIAKSRYHEAKRPLKNTAPPFSARAYAKIITEQPNHPFSFVLQWVSIADIQGQYNWHWGE